MDFKNNYRSFFVKFFTTCFGCGFFPIFPGVIGIILGTIISYLIHPLSFYNKFFITFFLIVLAIPLTGKAEKLFKKKDCPKIIIDEVIGVLLATMWFTNLPFVAFALVLLIFGLFDATKIYPAIVFHRSSGGLGIVMDDVVAGIYTAIIISIINSQFTIYGQCLNFSIFKHFFYLLIEN